MLPLWKLRMHQHFFGFPREEWEFVSFFLSVPSRNVRTHRHARWFPLPKAPCSRGAKEMPEGCLRDAKGMLKGCKVANFTSALGRVARRPKYMGAIRKPLGILYVGRLARRPNRAHEICYPKRCYRDPKGMPTDPNKGILRGCS